MSTVRIKSPNGTIYVYESKSYWDKELKQPRNKRVLIGKVDSSTGEVVPTRKRKESTALTNESKAISEMKERYDKQLKEKDKVIAELKRNNQIMKIKNKEILDAIHKIEEKYVD